MTEDFIEIVTKEYEKWRKGQEEYTKVVNKKIELENKKIEKIQKLLQDKKVKEFAEEIGYEERLPRKYLTLENSLYDFLKNQMSSIEWSKKELKQDKYPIYCFLKSVQPLYSTRTGKEINGYDDLYWNLQQCGYSFGPSDNKENGTKREEFIAKNIDNIIYPPKGKNFWDKETFYKVQTEFVEEALKTNQKEAKKLILAKYGRNNNK